MDLCPLYTGAWVNVKTAHGNGGEHDVMRYYLRALFAQMFIAVENVGLNYLVLNTALWTSASADVTQNLIHIVR